MAQGYTRGTDDAAPNKYSFQFINRNSRLEDLITIKATVASAGAALPQVSTVVQEFTNVSRASQSTIVCAGTIQKIGDSYGVLMNDTKAGEVGLFAISGRWETLLHGSATVTVGGDVYIASGDMLTSHDPTAREYLGIFVEDSGTDPDGGPSGDYAVVEIRQGEKA